MRRLTIKSAALALGCTAFADDASAHSLAQRYDLPLPLGYFLLAAGAAVAASFVILAVFWRNDGRRSQLDQPVLRGRIPFAIVISGQVFSVGILTLIVAAGFFGNQDTFKTLRLLPYGSSFGLA